MDTQIINKFKEISGIGEVGPKEALLGISQISLREYESLKRKLWGESHNRPEHSHWMFWDGDFVYIRIRPRAAGFPWHPHLNKSEVFIKIPSELVTKAVVLGEMPPNPIDSCVSDRLKETMKMKGEALVQIGNIQVLFDERPCPDDLKERILLLYQKAKDKLAEVEKTLESLLANAA